MEAERPSPYNFSALLPALSGVIGSGPSMATALLCQHLPAKPGSLLIQCSVPNQRAFSFWASYHLPDRWQSCSILAQFFNPEPNIPFPLFPKLAWSLNSDPGVVFLHVSFLPKWAPLLADSHNSGTLAFVSSNPVLVTEGENPLHGHPFKSQK